MFLQVVSLLTSSKELVDLLKNVDTVFQSKQAISSKSTLNSLYGFVPSIREQLQVNFSLNLSTFFFCFCLSV